MQPQNETTLSANDRQVDGDHYRKGGAVVYQHWDFAAQARLGYFEGIITKHLDRYADKGEPVTDLEKADHYAQKLIEIAYQGYLPNHPKCASGMVGVFLDQRVRSEAAAKALALASMWSNVGDLHEVRSLIAQLLDVQRAADQETQRQMIAGAGAPSPEYVNQDRAE